MLTSQRLIRSWLFIAALTCSGAPLHGRAPAPQEGEALPDALVIESAGLSALLPSPKDQGLVTLLRRLDRTAIGMADQFNGQPLPEPVVALVTKLLTAPLSLRLGTGEGGMMGGVTLQLDVYAETPREAEAFGQQIRELAQQMGPGPLVAAPDHPGAQMIDLGEATVYLGGAPGPRPGVSIGLDRFVTQPSALRLGLLPRDVQPVLELRFRGAELQPLAESMMAMGGLPPEFVQQQLRAMGLDADHPVSVEAAFGHGADRAHLAARVDNYRQVMAARGAGPGAPLTREALALVPARAAFAQVNSLDLSGLVELIRASATMQMQMGGVNGAADPLAQINDALGIDIEADLIDHLGDAVGGYVGGAGGGSSLTSLVLFAEVENADGLRRTLQQLGNRLREALPPEAAGNVEVRQITLDGIDMTILAFPGLPVPVQPALAIEGGWLFAAATPVTLRGAVLHARQGAPSLLDNTRFREAAGELGDDLVQVSFFDTPRLLEQGYATAALGVAALENMTLVGGGQPVIGVMPPYETLSEGAVAAVQLVRMEGDDARITAQLDRSALVNAAAYGELVGNTMLAGTMLGVALPALGQARQTARDTISQTTLRQMAIAVHVYIGEHERMPASLDALVEQNYIPADLLISPLQGAEMIPPPHYWMDTSRDGMEEIEAPAETILLYDRVSYATGGPVLVAFYDGSGRAIELATFRAMLELPQHAGVEFELP